MIRQHQFTKVELVSITAPETSKDEHERMLACAEEVLRQLDLHYRVMTLCAGEDRKSTRLNSSHLVISYAVFCLKKKNNAAHLLTRIDVYSPPIRRILI